MNKYKIKNLSSLCVQQDVQKSMRAVTTHEVATSAAAINYKVPGNLKARPAYLITHIYIYIKSKM
jgi:hypothetical protein